jgi:predicted CopG family antitoxin
MGSRPYFHILLFFFILGMNFDAPMSESPKKKPSMCERRTISFDPDLYALALQRMKQEGETMFSRYVQALVRKDTAELRAKALYDEKPFLSLVAEEPPEYGKPRPNATAPDAPRSSASYVPKKTKRQPE